MRHARDEVSEAIDIAVRVLVTQGRSEPAEADDPDVSWGATVGEGALVPTRNGQRIRLAFDSVEADRPAVVVRPGLRVFVGVDTDVDLVAQTTTSGVRFVTVLHGPKAPTEYRFPLELAEGMFLDLMPSGGYDVVHERYGATVGRLQAPLGCDAIFRPIRTDYHLDGSALMMSVRHEDALYPVVADPMYLR